jgi:hypothetical protein
MDRSGVLHDIRDYCRRAGMAESTFGRLAVNDGKLVSRIVEGARVRRGTLQRIEAFMDEHPPQDNVNALVAPRAGHGAPERRMNTQAVLSSPQGNKDFRFFDNRQKYLLFVNTCSEKWVVAERIARELANLKPTPPALRLFDAGLGDGTVLSRMLRAMHYRFPTMPFCVHGKEVSLEDIRLTLDKLPDRLFEHPATVVVLTNLYYAEAPWLTTNSPSAASRFVWKEVSLRGDSSHDFEQQIFGLNDFLSENWQARSGKQGNPVYDRPVVLILYREDHKFLLDPVLPRRGAPKADFDLVIASQPYRASASAAFKARHVVAPLARALAPSGRLIGIHSCGEDPGMEIVHGVWPDYNPFTVDRHAILKATREALGADARNYNFNAGSDQKSVFQYEMHTLPNEVTSAIGTSTLLAAWNAATYVAQVEDRRLEEVMSDNRYMEATRAVLQKHGGLWFNDESYVISRKG